MRKAFTLAEVLITLGIIGVVAVLIIPAAIAKYKKITTVAKLKKEYAVIQQAFKLAEAEYGPPDSWAEWDDTETILKKYFVPYLKTAEIYPPSDSYSKIMCYDGILPVKYSNAQYGWLDNILIKSPFTEGVTASVKLLNGTCIGINGTKKPEDWEHAYSYNVFIDINGSIKGPNKAGEDLFFFVLDKNQVKPYGYNFDDEHIYHQQYPNACNRKALVGGYTCAARIIRDGWKIKY